MDSKQLSSSVKFKKWKNIKEEFYDMSYML